MKYIIIFLPVLGQYTSQMFVIQMFVSDHLSLTQPAIRR